MVEAVFERHLDVSEHPRMEQEHSYDREEPHGPRTGGVPWAAREYVRTYVRESTMTLVPKIKCQTARNLNRSSVRYSSYLRNEIYHIDDDAFVVSLEWKAGAVSERLLTMSREVAERRERKRDEGCLFGLPIRDDRETERIHARLLPNTIPRDGAPNTPIFHVITVGRRKAGNRAGMAGGRDDALLHCPV